MAKIFPANTITVDFFGNAYYRPFEYKLATHNHVFSLSGDVIKNELVGLYLIAQMSFLAKLYSFNDMGTWPKIKEQSIVLPIRNNGEIDFDYIESRIRELEESRIRELEESRIRELEAYLIAAGFEDCALTQSERDCLQLLRQQKIALRSFKIGNIFNDFTGRDIIIRDTKEGNIPLISHQHDNNGISKYISPIEGRRVFNYKDTLSLADRGVFLATTQSQNFHIGTRVKALTFKEGEKSESVRLFFVAAINKLQIMFSEYLTNATDSLPRLSIILPVTDDGDIDYKFMDTYVNAVKKQCIAALKQEIAREHQAYEQAVGISVTEPEPTREKTNIIVLPQYREGYLPLYSFRVACGINEEQANPSEEAEGWVDASGLGFIPDPQRYFVVYAKGNSMIPRIHDGDLCVFEWGSHYGGTRNGEIVLVRTPADDNEYQGKFTIKKYTSEWTYNEDGEREHSKIELLPLNTDGYEPILLDQDEPEPHYIVGVFKTVIA